MRCGWARSWNVLVAGGGRGVGGGVCCSWVEHNAEQRSCGRILYRRDGFMARKSTVHGTVRKRSDELELRKPGEATQWWGTWADGGAGGGGALVWHPGSWSVPAPAGDAAAPGRTAPPTSPVNNLRKKTYYAKIQASVLELWSMDLEESWGNYKMFIWKKVMGLASTARLINERVFTVLHRLHGFSSCNFYIYFKLMFQIENTNL